MLSWRRRLHILTSNYQPFVIGIVSYYAYARTAPVGTSKPSEDEGEDLPDEDIYMSNVASLRGAIEPIYATRKANVHEDSIYSSV